MNHQLGTAEFFALEAGESLDRLEALIGRDSPPSGDDLLRTVRLLRGAALMAGHQPIARAAASLEAVARARRDGRRAWDAAIRAQIGQAIEDFRLLVGRAGQWDDTDTSRALRLGQRLDALAGRNPADAAMTDREELNTGVRAFVAREGALIASALDRAARALLVSPGDREPLYAVIRKMQSLRGLAELGELAPLPEILDGIELAVGDLTRLFAPPPGVEEVVAAAARALTRISRDIADRGRPDPDAEEAHRFTELLIRAFAVERDVVPIESLYFTGDPDPVTAPLSQPQFAPPAPLSPLELVSHGEHLCQTADMIARARSTTERDLRLYHLLGTLRSVGGPGPDPVGASLGVFARSAREALAAGVAGHATAAFCGCLREAGELLRAVADADDRMVISRRILDVAYQMDGLRLAEAPVAVSSLAARHHPPGVREREIVPIESLLYDAPDSSLESTPVIPIESLAPDSDEAVRGVPIESLAPDSDEAAPVVPIESLAPDPDETGPVAAPAAPSGLERSYSTYDRLRHQPVSEPSLAGLLGESELRSGPPEELRAREAAVEADATVEIVETIEIGLLCYRGRAALERAVAVRQQLADELTRHGGLDSVRPLLQELMDLVPLALAES